MALNCGGSKGSHHQLKHADGRLVTVAHPRKDIPIGTLRNILQDSRLAMEFGRMNWSSL